MNILGIAFLSDASACVLQEGELVAAVSEERLNRKKLWHGIPRDSVTEVLKLAGLTLKDIDCIATHGLSEGGPDLKGFEAKLNLIKHSDLSADWKREQTGCLESRLAHERQVHKERTPGYLKGISEFDRPVETVTHHTAHAASAYFGSGWEESYILTADGWGEDASASLWFGKAGRLKRLSCTSTFDSLGYFYGSITKALGFIPHRHEGKILGLAALERYPKSYPTIRSMIDYDKSQKRFIAHIERGYYVPRFENPRLSAFVKDFSREDIASAAQRSLEEVVLDAVEDIPAKNFKLCLAGGIFANVKLNQRILEQGKVSELFVFPNMGDGGLSVGAAYQVYFQKTGKSPKPFRSALLGREYSNSEIEIELKRSQLTYEKIPNIQEKVGELLSKGRVVARFHGRMEFGPRALGSRSILYQATEPEVNQWLNQRLNRSEFMPFAPATLSEAVGSLYEGGERGTIAARYMTTTLAVSPKMQKESPAAVHVDGTARPQFVAKDLYPDFYAILTAYRQRTGLATCINTSFNMHEEPIVASPQDAIRAIIDGRLPFLAIGDYLVKGNDSWDTKPTKL